MHNYPYPPEWFKRSSVEPLDALDEYTESLLFWVEDCWDDFLDDERRSVWKVTLYAGTAALILLLLLFQSSFHTDLPEKGTLAENSPAPKIDLTQSVKQKNQNVLTEVTPNTESPTKPVDPFDMYGSPSTNQPKLPAIAKHPKPDPAFNDPFQPSITSVFKPGLVIDVTETDLSANFQFSEKPVIITSQGRFIPSDFKKTELATGWHVSRPQSAFNPTEKKVGSWFDRAENSEISSLMIFPAETATLNSQEHNSAVFVTKNLPENMAVGSAITYELIVQNQGTAVQQNIVVDELVSDHQTVIDVIPAAQIAGDSLQWRIDSLNPGQAQRLKITCIAPNDLSVLKTETQLHLSYAIDSTTHVIAPDVVVSLTLPVSVEQFAEFAVQIEIANNSDRSYANADLNLHLLKGMMKNNSKDLTSKINVPAPGQSILIPLTLTAVDPGTGIIEAELDLEQGVIVPVKAHIQVRVKDEQKQHQGRDTVARKNLSNWRKST